MTAAQLTSRDNGELITAWTTNAITPGPTGFAARCSDKHEDTLFTDRAEWVAHQKAAHRNTAARFRPAPAPKAYVSIGPKESEQLGRWVTDPRGKFGQVISLAPGRGQVWVSFGGRDIARFGIWELTGAAAPAHTLSLLDSEPMPTPATPVALAPAPVAPALAPVVTVAPEAKQAARPPRRRTPARPAAHARNGHTGPNGADVAAYWQSIEARYFAAIA